MKEYFSPKLKIVESEEKNSSAAIPILCTNPSHFLPSLAAEMESLFHVSYGYNLTREEVVKKLPLIQGWLVNPGAPYKIDAELLSYAPNLKFIVTPSTGSDHIDKKYCEQKGIVWKALRGTEKIIENIHASAEFSFALLMAMIRHLPRAVYAARLGYWRSIEDEFRGIELSGKNVALIGYGRIGRKMARYLRGFDALVSAYDPYVSVQDDWVRQYRSVEELLPTADIVCLHIHLDETTRHFFNERLFSLLKPGSYFLNTSRGGCVDEQALIAALKSGRLKAAAVDVIEGEQQEDITKNLLIQYAQENDNLIVSPHIAGLTVDSQAKAARFAVDELKSFFGY